MIVKFLEAACRAACVAAAVLAGMASWDGASAYTETTLHAFCSDCPEGYNPNSLVRDASGNLYGTDESGHVFELTPKGKHGWQFHVIAGLSGDDGSSPSGPLIIDSAGNLYGTANAGGARGGGTAYELMPPTSGKKKWKLKALVQFCAQAGCADGKFPGGGLTYVGAASGAPYDGTSPLYGTTGLGGGFNEGGIFALTPGKKWHSKVIYSFCAEAPCNDGAQPSMGLIADGAGNLYGTTQSGNASSAGTIFELIPNARKTKWSLVQLYDFVCTGQNGCSDGGGPQGRLLMDASGNLFGTTNFGGAGSNCTNSSGCGVLFEVLPNGARSQYSVLYDFCSQSNCNDGETPGGGVIADPSGNLYGVTEFGGGFGAGSGGGVVYELSGTSLTVPYAFCAQANCADGQSPFGSLVTDPAGNLFGTTLHGGPLSGGTAESGTVFELTP